MRPYKLSIGAGLAPALGRPDPSGCLFVLERGLPARIKEGKRDESGQDGRTPGGPNTKPPKGWHSRGYPPHFNGGTLPQTVTFRLADALPKALLDRFVRNSEHFARAVDYIEMNPVAAGLCLRPEDWPNGSARFRRSAGFQPAS